MGFVIPSGKRGSINNRITIGAIGSSATYFTDLYFPDLAVSTRQLNGSITNCMRIREDSGDTETDIGFVDGWLDEAAIAAHCGSNGGWVTKWYDQSGNGYDLSNLTAGLQPQIYNGTSVFQSNSKPSVWFGTSLQSWYLNGSQEIILNSLPFSVSTVRQWGGTNNSPLWSHSGSTSIPEQVLQTTRELWRGSTFLIAPPASTSMQSTFGVMYPVGTESTFQQNNNSPTLDSIIGEVIIGVTVLRLGWDNTYRYHGYISEFIGWNSDQDAIREDVNADNNAAFGIY
jgi:hypothetical protein